MAKEFDEYEPSPDEDTSGEGATATEGQQEVTAHVLPAGTKLQKEMTSLFIDKTEFLSGEKEFKVSGLGVNKFGKKTLIGSYKGQERSLNINKGNVNDLIDLLGDDLDSWKGQKLIISGKAFAGDPSKDIRDGVTLTFRKGK